MRAVGAARPINYPDHLPSRAFGQPSLGMIEDACVAMREDEIEQYKALTGAVEFKPRIAALGFGSIMGVSYGLLQDNCRVACVGGYGLDPNVDGLWHSWAAGTQEGWDLHWRDITKVMKFTIRSLFEHAGAHRLETQVLASRALTRAWYEKSLGLQYEGTRRCYNKYGESIAIYALTRDDWEQIEEDRNGRRK